MPRRILVIGSPGAGKSTLARSLADRLDVASVDLDDLVNHAGSALELDQSCYRLAEQPTWVCEGIYCGWTEPLMERAEVIVWLDLPAPLTGYRIIRRHLRRSLAGDNPHRGLRRLAGFTYRAVWRYHRAPSASDAVLAAGPEGNSRATTADRLRPHLSKVWHVCSRAGVRRLRERLLSGTPGPIGGS